MYRLLILLLLLPIAACGSDADLSSPEAAATAWLEAQADDDEEALMECIVDTERRAILQGIERAEEANRELPEYESNIVEFVVHGAEISGNRAVVNVTVTRELSNGEKQSEEKIVCLKEKKQWKVSQAGTKTENRAPVSE